MPKDFDRHNDILLGPSSLAGLEDKFSDWESYIIEPDPFSTIAQMERVTEDTARCANSLIPYMTEHLNKLNNLNHSAEFWRILIFPWLLIFIQVLWERHLRVKSIINKYSDEQLEIKLIGNKHRWHFQNTFDFYYDGALNIAYNEWLLSRLIEKNKPPNWKLKYEDKKPVKQGVPVQSWKRQFYDKHFISLRCKDVIGANPLEAMILSWLLSLKRRNKKVVLDGKGLQNETKVKFLKEADELLINFIIKELPACFKNIISLNHKNPKPQKGKIRIVSAFDINFNENYKKYLAHCVEGKEKIIPTQHGAYGTALFHTWPKEVEFFHKSFITWGWKQYNKYHCNFIDNSSPFLSKFDNKHKRKNNNLILVGTMINIISEGINAVPQPLQQIRYIKEKISFIKNLHNKIYNNFLYRSYYRKQGTIDEEKLIRNIFRDIRLLQGNLHDAILECKLLILDHPGTTLNIALAANIPTICYWDEDLFPVCEQMKPFLHTFEKTGVLFKDGTEAATKVNEIWGNVDSWWAQKDIQFARREFCWNYARTSKFWLYDWIKMIISL